MKTLQVTRRFTRSSWGGTETVVLQLCRELLAAGHSTEIVTSKALDSTAEEDLQGVPVHRFDHFYPWFGLDASRRRALDDSAGNLFSWDLYHHLQRCAAPDVVHLHTGKRLGGIVRKACLQRRVPYVVSLHGGVLDLGGDTAERFGEATKGKLEWGKLLGWWVGSRRVLEDAAGILCVGREEQRRIADAYPQVPVHYLPNGVDTRQFAAGDGPAMRRRWQIPQERFLMLQVGRLDPQKNQLGMVDRLGEVVRAGVDAHLLLIGHATHETYSAQLHQRIEKDAQLRDRVTMIPGVDPTSSDLVDAYHAADLFVLPSIHEPFGVVALEAWAAGTPVIASAVGGIPDFVVHRENGVLAGVEDDDAWVREIVQLARADEQRRKFAEAGRSTACAEYDWQAISKRLLNVYAEVAA